MGHCWRRSSAIEAVGAGAMSSDLKRGYGWKQDAKAMKYLNKGTDQAVKMTGLIKEGRSFYGYHIFGYY